MIVKILVNLIKAFTHPRNFTEVWCGVQKYMLQDATRCRPTESTPERLLGKGVMGRRNDASENAKVPAVCGLSSPFTYGSSVTNSRLFIMWDQLCRAVCNTID